MIFDVCLRKEKKNYEIMICGKESSRGFLFNLLDPAQLLDIHWTF